MTKSFLLESFKESPDLLHHMTTQISPELLIKNNIAASSCRHLDPLLSLSPKRSMRASAMASMSARL